MLPEETSSEALPTGSETQQPRKRPRQPASDPRYPRKRSVKACHVCRARKTKCDNAQPTCGFCASLNIPCSYDASEKDHSTFDPASLEILKQLGQIIRTQDDVLHSVREITASQCLAGRSLVSPTQGQTVPNDIEDGINWDVAVESQDQQFSYTTHEWFGGHTDSAVTTPAASAGVAAARWFGLLTNHASPEVPQAFQEEDARLGLDKELLNQTGTQGLEHPTPLQRATKVIDDVHDSTENVGENFENEASWQASESIALLDEEKVLLQNFLCRICPWLDLFDPAKTFSTRVPHLALRNAGLLNAIMALSCYHQSLDINSDAEERPDEHTALQYYYQTLHYVQKAMRQPSYQKSQELMATTLVVSTYEMLRGSRKDWQQHLKGVFWILRSRQIEVEASSLESTTWWAWLRQDIWAAFREKRRTYSTWTPKKSCSELNSHELASRATWILAQVVNFCAGDASTEDLQATVTGRLGWAEALKKMLDEWNAHLTVEFTPLPTMGTSDKDEAFQARLIHPQCFGLAVQMHHVSRILLAARAPCIDGIEGFLQCQKRIQESIEMVCGIGMTLTEDASSMLSSQCLFIAGVFAQDLRQREKIIDMLNECQKRCGWPTPSLSSELLLVWESPSSIWRL